LDTGLFALNAGADGSIGAVVDVPIVRPVSVYAGAGAGFALAVGATTPKGCDSSTTDCPVVPGSYGGGYTYARIGTAVRFGRTARHVVGLDVAIWRGQNEEEIDRQVTEKKTYLMIVPGVSYHWAF
jgi:opacity protein-like surface antigen